MKKIFILFAAFCFTVTLSIAQIPTIKSIGGGGRNINYSELKKSDTIEPGYFYNDCAQGVDSVAASSTLAPQGKFNFSVNNLRDFDPTTAWCEGKPGYGIGEWFEVKSVDVNIIYNGYQYSPTVWAENSRVKKFKVYKNGTPLCYLELTDEMGPQSFELSPERDYDYKNVPTFRFEIVEVYKGLKYDDVCISHVDLVLCCFASGTMISDGTKQIPVDEIAKGQKIVSIDVNSGNNSEAEIVSITKQTHLSLFKVTTATKEIEITADHPLYVKDQGFVSLSHLLKKFEYSNVDQLVNHCEVLTWNYETNSTMYEKITGIEKQEGVFETYSVLKISKGASYIANGFVTKTY